MKNSDIYLIIIWFIGTLLGGIIGFVYNRTLVGLGLGSAVGLFLGLNIVRLITNKNVPTKKDY